MAARNGGPRRGEGRDPWGGVLGRVPPVTVDAEVELSFRRCRRRQELDVEVAAGKILEQIVAFGRVEQVRSHGGIDVEPGDVDTLRYERPHELLGAVSRDLLRHDLHQRPRDRGVTQQGLLQPDNQSRVLGARPGGVGRLGTSQGQAQDLRTPSLSLPGRLHRDSTSRKLTQRLHGFLVR